MRNERKIIQDSTLGVEALLFNGIQQEFPNHWHEYYVIGLMEAGTRQFTCQNTCYIVEAGDLILIPPKAAHRCPPLPATHGGKAGLPQYPLNPGEHGGTSTKNF